VTFEIKPMNPETYRRQTRRSTIILALIFAVLAVGLSVIAVKLFGEPGGDNFYLNLAGVLVGLAIIVALVRFQFWSQPWMAPAVYGWQLKRSLMRVTNVMHQVTAGVKTGDPTAMKLLRFYHLGLTQMHQLDGNTGAYSQAVRVMDEHKLQMEAAGMDTELNRLDVAWLEAMKSRK
jgi:Protein of unknown function (DUF3087)